MVFMITCNISKEGPSLSPESVHFITLNFTVFSNSAVRSSTQSYYNFNLNVETVAKSRISHKYDNNLRSQLKGDLFTIKSHS
jgi:hypothetical protein